MLSNLFKQAQRFTTNNSTTILTTLGVIGTVSTAVLTAKGTTQAVKVLEDSVNAPLGAWEYEALSFKEKATLTWKCYIPAATTGAVTIACIIGANRIGSHRTAAIAAAYTLSEKAFVEYKDKVVENIGKNKEQRVRDDIEQDKVTRTPVPSTLIVGESEKQLCFDSYSSRYFLSTIEELKSAQNRLNHQILAEDYASLSDFYDCVGLEHTQFSDDIGWNGDELLELSFSACVSPEQKPAISMMYHTEPIRGFHRLH